MVFILYGYFANSLLVYGIICLILFIIIYRPSVMVFLCKEFSWFMGEYGINILILMICFYSYQFQL